MSLVSWPCRYSAASCPLSSSLPRAERSSRPHSSRSCLYWASSSTVAASVIPPILGRRERRPRSDHPLALCPSGLWLQAQRLLDMSNSFRHVETFGDDRGLREGDLRAFAAAR